MRNEKSHKKFAEIIININFLTDFFNFTDEKSQKTITNSEAETSSKIKTSKTKYKVEFTKW